MCLQLNTARSSPITDAAIATAHKQGVEVVYLQEPWVGEDEDGNTLTKSHPGYRKYLPLGQGRPKTAVYVAKGTRACQKPICSNNIVRITVRGVEIFNVYRESRDKTTFTEIERHAKGGGKQLVVGDFNARHQMWQPGAESTGIGSTIAHWADRRGFDLWTEGRPTHDKGNTIDLTFARGLIGGAAEAEEWEAGSDHHPIRIAVANPTEEKSNRWKTFSVPDLDKFQAAVRAGKGDIPSITDIEGLDIATTALTDWLGAAIRAVGTVQGTGRSKRAG